MEIYDPKNITGNEKKITSIRFRRLEKIPHTLYACHQLKSLVLIKCSIKTIADSIVHLQELEQLIIRDCNLEELPSCLAQLKQLKYIEITGNNIKTVPKELASGSEKLDLCLANNKISAIAKDFFAPNTCVTQLNLNSNVLLELPDLEEDCLNIKDLRIGGNQLQVLPPDFIRKMKGLSFLDIRNNPYKELPLAVLNLDTKHGGCRLYAQEVGFEERLLTPEAFHALLKAFNAVSLDFKHRKVAYQLLTTSSEVHFDEFSLLSCMSLSHHEIVEAALERLLEQNKARLEQHPLTENSEVTVFGKTNIPNRTLREKLKERGLKYVTKVKASTTHIVVAPPIKRSYAYDQKELVFISEDTLLQFLEVEKEEYLKMEETRQVDIDHLRSLLFHKDQHNRTLALTLMQEGGVPKPLLTDLFLIWRNTQNETSFRKKVLQLLKRHASKTLKSKLSAKVRPIMRETLDEYTLDENLQHYTKDTELDAWRIGRFVFKNYKNGLRFWLRHLSKEEQDTLIHFLIEKRPDFVLHSSYFQKLDDLFVYKNAKRVVIEKLDLEVFPKELLTFKQLWNLSLGHNRISELPEDFVQLQRLHTLNIKYNNFKTFPKLLEKMPKLKVIVVAMNPFVWDRESVDRALYFYDEITAKRK